jgi:hypothetical protein
VNDSSATDWIERPRAAWLAVWPIALTALRLVFRRKLFWLMLGFALLNFLFVFCAIYLLATLKAQQPEIGKMLSVMLPDLAGTGKTFLNFMFAQGTVTMILLAFAGSVLAGNDHLRGGLTFYLSRRISVLHYVGGKLLAIGLLVSLTTTLPALVLFLEQGMLGDTAKYFGENYNIGYGLLISVTLGLLLFALVSWMPRPVPLVMSWACLFFFLPVLSEILSKVFDDRQWRLLNLWRDIYAVGSRCFGEAAVRSRDVAQLSEAAAVIVAVCLLSFIAIVFRIRQLRHQS